MCIFHTMICNGNPTALINTLTSNHYNDVIMSAMVSQITGFAIVYSTVYSGIDQRKLQSTASLAFVWGIHRWQVNSAHKKASNGGNVSIWWRQHAYVECCVNAIRKYVKIAVTNFPMKDTLGFLYCIEPGAKIEWFYILPATDNKSYLKCCIFNDLWHYLSIPKIQRCNR